MHGIPCIYNIQPKNSDPIFASRQVLAQHIPELIR